MRSTSTSSFARVVCDVLVADMVFWSSVAEERECFIEDELEEPWRVSLSERVVSLCPLFVGMLDLDIEEFALGLRLDLDEDADFLMCPSSSDDESESAGRDGLRCNVFVLGYLVVDGFFLILPEVDEERITSAGEAVLSLEEDLR